MTWKDIPEDNPPTPPQRLKIGGYGTLGKKIELTTNFFEVEVKNKNLVLYHYDVAIADNKKAVFNPPLPKSMNMKIFERMKVIYSKEFGSTLFAYDSMKSACSTSFIKKLENPITYTVKLKNEGKAAVEQKKSASKSTYHVTMVLVNKISLNQLFESMKYVPGRKIEIDSSAIQLIEIMFRHALAIKFTQICHRHFYSLEEEFAFNRRIGGGKLGVTGFFGSIRPTGWKNGALLLNIDMTHTAFYEPIKLFEFILTTKASKANIGNFDITLNVRQASELTSKLKGLKIKVTYSSYQVRTYKINCVHHLGPRETEFDYTTDDKTSKITVEDYYNERYGIELQHPLFNCINVGNENKPVFIPPELCSIAKGQRVKNVMGDESKEMMKLAAVPPAERFQEIKKVVSKNKFNENEYLKEMTFTILERPLEIEGRILPPPVLTMDENTKIIPFNGYWNVQDKPFHRPAKLRKWAVINYDDARKLKDIKEFILKLRSMGKKNGMEILEPFEIWDPKTFPNPREDLEHYKENNPDIELVMFILPANKTFYGVIKTVGDLEVNIMTQCVKGLTVYKKQPQTIQNILLKMNAKLNGVNTINTVLELYKTGLMEYREPFLIMGADVSHPAAGSETTVPSIVAVVGSYEISGAKYSVEIREQFHGREVIQEMKEITKNLLRNFIERARIPPNRIIMYRDGVSDSQFLKVLAHEMMAMRKACSEIRENYEPGITFICVQKRHHTRFLCDEKYTKNQSNKNVPPGTIVDRHITHPNQIDFYLCSQEGIKGTSRPAHYQVLWDDNDIPIDELHMLTYKLCHLYARCSKSVSIPAPVYYAHLAAYRAKLYVSEIMSNGSQQNGKRNGENGNGSQQNGKRNGENEKLKEDIIKGIRLSALDSSSTKFFYI